MLKILVLCTHSLVVKKLMYTNNSITLFAPLSHACVDTPYVKEPLNGARLEKLDTILGEIILTISDNMPYISTKHSKYNDVRLSPAICGAQQDVDIRERFEIYETHAKANKAPGEEMC